MLTVTLPLLACSTKVQAEAYCTNMGARLCSITELLTGETAGSGVSFYSLKQRIASFAFADCICKSPRMDGAHSKLSAQRAASLTCCLHAVQLRSVPRLESNAVQRLQWLRCEACQIKQLKQSHQRRLTMDRRLSDSNPINRRIHCQRQY